PTWSPCRTVSACRPCPFAKTRLSCACWWSIRLPSSDRRAPGDRPLPRLSNAARVLIALILGASAGLVLAWTDPALGARAADLAQPVGRLWLNALQMTVVPPVDRKSTRLNSSHVKMSYAVFCL